MTHTAQAPRLITADVLYPMDSSAPRLMREAGIVITGERIEAVDHLPALRRRFGELPAEHHQGLLMPGLINAHTHLELSYLRGLLQPQPFPQWVEKLLTYSAPGSDFELLIEKATQGGMTESLTYGITMLADNSRHVQASRAAFGGTAARSLRIISFGEIMSLGTMRGRLVLGLQNAADPSFTSRLHSPGLGPHAPYTVEDHALGQVVETAIKRNLPISMHLAENLAEADFLRNLSGPLGRDWPVMQKLNTLDDQVPLYKDHGGSPIFWSAANGLLRASASVPVLLVHLNYCSDEELALLTSAQASVVYCPRTRRFFGHDQVGPHRYRDMLDARINVCLGTDSLASNPDLSPLREAQLLVSRDHLDPHLALEMITRRPAAALGRGSDLGMLAAGMLADLAIFPLPAGTDKSTHDVQLVAAFVKSAPNATAVWVAGARLF